jgi:integrase
MRKALNAKSLEGLKPDIKPYEVHDVLCPGLSIRVSTQGRKVFTVKYRYGLKQRRIRLGVYPLVTLAQAREKALEALRQVDVGIDPAARRRQLGMRVRDVCEDYIRHYARPRNRSWKETERILDREFVTVHGEQDVRHVTRADIIALMDRAIERGAKYQANRIHAHLRKFYAWCLERGIVETSPVLGTRAPTREQARDRVLNEAEIVDVLNACAADSYPYRQFVPLLLATAQRRGEVSRMLWSDVDLEAKVWVIPSSLSKNGKAHVVPLSEYALGLLREIPRFPDCEIVFSTTRRAPISGFSKAIRHIHARSGTSEWRFHDLRRTAASGMAKLGAAPHVIEKVLNHISGMSPLAATYNRYAYDAERREALEAWGRCLQNMKTASRTV